MGKIAIIEKYPSAFKYESIFPFEFDKYSLVEEKANKVLKRDIQLDISKVKNDYEYLILVGKEACKFIGNISSVTDYQGYLLEEKYLGLLNPIAVNLTPSLKPAFDIAIESIIKTVNGDGTLVKKDLDVKLLDTEYSATKYLTWLLEEVMNGRIKKIAMDTETSSFYPRNGYLLGISISHKFEQGVYIDALALSDELIEFLQKIIYLVTVVFHNAKFDMKFLKYHLGLIFAKWEDSMLEHYVLDENAGHGLKPLAIRYTELGDYDKELEDYKANYCRTHGIKIGDFTYDLIPNEILYKYASLDTASTLELDSKFLPHIVKNPKLENIYENFLKEGTIFLMKVEENGIPINKDLVIQYIDDINNEIKFLTENLYKYKEIKKVEEITGVIFNVNSVPHKRMLFFNVLGLNSLKKTETGGDSTDAEVMEELAKQHELPSIIQSIQKLKKVRATYLEKFLEGIDYDGRLRTNFNLHTTTSGRLSSSGKINAQQLPRKDKRPKRCIEAKSGFKIVSQDLKTAEMYVAAVLSGDKNLQRIFIDKVDYHGAMAVLKFHLGCDPNEVAELFADLRQDAKTISFEILYKLNYQEEALENFKKLKQWLKNQEAFIKKNGYIYSFFGRKRRLSDVFSPSKKDAQHEVRSGINFLVQSVASDINLLAGIEMQKWIEANGYEEDMRIFGLVHDSILAEVREEFVDLYTKKLAEITQKDRGLSIPGCPIGVDVEVGTNYAFINEDLKAT